MRGSGRILALLLGVLASLTLAELLLRGLAPAQLSIIQYPCIYRPDPVTGFRYLPRARGLVAAHFEIENRVETNSLGFYDDEPLPGEAEPRILAVGDSFTAAMNVARDQTWTAVLEQRLRAGGAPRADVINLGIDGTGTDVHAELLREYAPRFAPDWVLLAFYANDVGDVRAGRFERECYRDYVLSYPTVAHRDRLRARVDAHQEQRLRRALHRHSFLVRLLAAVALPAVNPYRMHFLQPRRAELEHSPSQRQAARARWRGALDALEELASRCGCRLRVVPVPPRSEPRGSLRAWRKQEGTADFQVVDLLPALERLRLAAGLRHEDLYFRHDHHLNARGNALLGRALAEILSRESTRPNGPGV